MAKVLFFNLPAYGHTYPTLPLVAELVRRGEHVIYYSSEAFRSAILEAGATFRGIDPFFNEQHRFLRLS
jgi:UDP:flavonoid glycosyltransferase YjiC (YdhE family)